MNMSFSDEERTKGMVEHGGVVTTIEASQGLARCYCGWRTIERSFPEAQAALHQHVTEQVALNDPKGKTL